MVLGYAFDKLIKSLNEVSDLTFVSNREASANNDNVHPRNKGRNFVTKES